MLTIRAVAAATIPHVDAVVVLDDGSTDGTSEALAGLGVRVIRYEANAGKGARLAEGLALAFAEGAGAVITLDADGQHDPADIPTFRAASARHPGALVLGNRFGDIASMPRGRARAIRFGDFFIGWACERRVSDAQCGMRLYPHRFAEVVRMPPSAARHFVFETAALFHAAKAGIAFVDVPVDARYEGFLKRPSHYRPLRDTLRIVGAIASFLLAHRLQPRGLLIALGLVHNRGNTSEVERRTGR